MSLPSRGILCSSQALAADTDVWSEGRESRGEALEDLPTSISSSWPCYRSQPPSTLYCEKPRFPSQKSTGQADLVPRSLTSTPRHVIGRSVHPHKEGNLPIAVKIKCLINKQKWHPRNQVIKEEVRSIHALFPVCFVAKSIDEKWDAGKS